MQELNNTQNRPDIQNRPGVKGKKNAKTELFETAPVPRALFTMAVPTIVSQLIVLIYNMADTWFIGRTNNPYMVAASSLVLTVFMMTIAIANLFGVGGGSLMVRLLGAKDPEESRRVASLSLVLAAAAAAVFSLFCFFAMDPLLRLLGASDLTIGYAKQYLAFVVVIGSLPTVLSNTMATMLRNAGYSREAAFGLGAGGVLNIVLDPLFMFVILPDGYQVMGAGIATMLSNVFAMIYFVRTYLRVRSDTVLDLPHRIEKVRKSSLASIFAVGFPAGFSLFLFDLSNMMLNRLSAAHGDIELAGIGIVLKVERLPLNTGIGICLGMVPLVAYNYAARNYRRMNSFLGTARAAGLIVAALSAVLYRLNAERLIRLFIEDPATVAVGTSILSARCFATPFMFLSFHMVHFMNAIGKGRVSFSLAVIRQLVLNIPILFLLDHLFGMDGIVWTQLTADVINVLISYLIYYHFRSAWFPEAEAA